MQFMIYKNIKYSVEEKRWIAKLIMDDVVYIKKTENLTLAYEYCREIEEKFILMGVE